MKDNKLVKVLGMGFCVLLSGMSPSEASLLELTHEPLFLNKTVPPAIIVTFDDSGSMAWGFMGDGMSDSSGTYDSKDFVRPDKNKLYYNPNINYTPPIDEDGNQYPDSTFTNAWVDGYNTNFGRVNLSNRYLPIARFYDYADGSKSLRFAKIPNLNYVSTVSTNNFGSYPDQATRGARGRKAFYFNGNTRVNIPTAQETNFANWYSYYNTRLKLGKTAMSRAFSTFGPSFKVSWQQLNRNTGIPDLAKFEGNHREDFFDWLFDVPSDGGTPLRNAFYRAGREFTYDRSYEYIADSGNVEKLSCQQNFHIAVSDGAWNGGLSYSNINQDETNLTGGPSGDTANEYGGYNGNGEQRIYPKSESGSTLSDIAFHYWHRDLKGNIDNNVKRYKKDYTDADGMNITLNPGDDEWDNNAFVWNPKNDPAYWQHMVNYNVGMGLEASLVVDYIKNTNSICPKVVGVTDPKEAVYLGLRNGDCSWPNASNDSNKIDDVWHASINSRGDFFSANDPDELIKSLNAVVNDIIERLSRGATSSVSSGVVTDSTKAYSPGFDSANWTGNLFAKEVGNDGTFGTTNWDLSCILTGGNCDATGNVVAKQSTRDIYTFDPITDSVHELGNSLPAGISTLLLQNLNALLTRTGATLPDFIDYIKGDQSTELLSGGRLRDRQSVLSDIVHSSPVILRGPGALYSDESWPLGSPEYMAAQAGNGYQDFKLANKDRNNVLFVGSNSGMLHAIDIDEGSSEGQEIWGYIPSMALPNLYKLADPQFEHHSYVDNSVVISDAFINGQWRSVLIGGMRYGGQGFYALDVTNVSSGSPPIVLWEFTDEDDSDMGYSYGKAEIARVSSTGEWVALIPNGYNNSEADGLSVSTAGTSVLYVVRLSDGALLAELDTGEGSSGTPNGMASAKAVDSKFWQAGTYKGDQSGNDIGMDYAYAGDLYGNLWRFDFTSSSYSDWENSSSIQKVVSAVQNKHRPITIQPRIVNYPNSLTSDRDSIVIFGTGKYIEIPDRSLNLPSDQFLVGLYDGLTDPGGQAGLSGIDIRTANLQEHTFQQSNNLRELANGDPDIGNYDGWRIRLPDTGERIANPLSVLSRDLMLAASTITAGEDPCEGGGISWLIAIDPITGGLPAFGNIFESDVIVGTDPDGNPITGIEVGTGLRINDLIVGRPPVLDNLGGGAANIVIEGANGTTTVALKKYTWRRRNWTNLLTE